MKGGIVCGRGSCGSYAKANGVLKVINRPYDKPSLVKLPHLFWCLTSRVTFARQMAAQVVKEQCL